MNRNGIRILIVEKDPHAGVLLSTWLEQAGYNVLLVCHASNALTELNKRRFDMVLAGYPTPSIPMPALLNHIRARGLETPVILVSSMLPHASISDDVLQPFAWLHTPYTRSVLLRLVCAATYATAQSRKGNASAVTTSQ